MAMAGKLVQNFSELAHGEKIWFYFWFFTSDHATNYLVGLYL